MAWPFPSSTAALKINSPESWRNGQHHLLQRELPALHPGPEAQDRSLVQTQILKAEAFCSLQHHAEEKGSTETVIDRVFSPRTTLDAASNPCASLKAKKDRKPAT